jgi:hypothetical protein
MYNTLAQFKQELLAILKEKAHLGIVEILNS